MPGQDVATLQSEVASGISWPTAPGEAGVLGAGVLRAGYLGAHGGPTNGCDADDDAQWLRLAHLALLRVSRCLFQCFFRPLRTDGSAQTESFRRRVLR